MLDLDIIRSAAALVSQATGTPKKSSPYEPSATSCASAPSAFAIPLTASLNTLFHSK